MTDGAFTLVDARGQKYLTAPERGRFLAVARAHPKPGVQTLARTLAMTGCRVSEALGIRACDVDLEANELRIATLKRRTEHWRAVPVLEDLVHALELVHRLRRLQRASRSPTVAAVLGHVSLTTTALYTTAIGAEACELVSRVWE